MRRLIFLFSVIVSLAGIGALAFSVQAQQAKQVLPSSFAGWNAASKASFGLGNLPSADQGAAANEYGFAGGERDTYTRGKESIRVDLYQMKDPSGAYGEYSYLRTPDMARAKLTDHSSLSSARALMLVGNFVLDVQGQGLQHIQTNLKALVQAVQPRADAGALPTLWQRLPTKGFVDQSDRYVLGPQTLDQFFPGALGDTLGFSSGAEVEVAHYRVAGHDAQLLIADFPTPQIADQSLIALRKKFNINGSMAANVAPQLFAKRSLTLVAVVAGAPTAEVANALLDQVHSGTELTWNEPPFEVTQPGILTIVVGTLIGTGVLCAFALVAGLSFAGFRLLIKRALPGKVFDRTKEIQVLQLGLSSKPINAQDFYDPSGPAPVGPPVDKKLPDRTALRLFR
jgi:hypothetical protein